MRLYYNRENHIKVERQPVDGVGADHAGCPLKLAKRGRKSPRTIHRHVVAQRELAAEVARWDAVFGR